MVPNWWTLTILAPGGYVQNLLSSAETIKQGAIYGSAGDGAGAGEPRRTSSSVSPLLGAAARSVGPELLVR
jgi:hypothetical protein